MGWNIGIVRQLRTGLRAILHDVRRVEGEGEKKFAIILQIKKKTPKLFLGAWPIASGVLIFAGYLGT